MRVAAAFPAVMIFYDAPCSDIATATASCAYNATLPNAPYLAAQDLAPGTYCIAIDGILTVAGATSGDFHLFVELDNRAGCGDGVQQSGESCDDGNQVGGDGCAADCTTEIFFDDFDGATNPDLSLWASWAGSVAINSTYRVSLSNSMALYADDGVATTVAMDTSACNQITWGYDVLRGPINSPEATDILKLEYLNSGSSWVEVDGLPGAIDGGFFRHRGTISKSDAKHASLQFRLSSNGTAGNLDYFFIDNIFVDCR
ncbi:hypothetical protein KAI87_15945 [Myxococcota bacterium]|nr:hypothetical protein [Myxococcota bacterium]